jgi:hypothetical protein
MDGAAQVHVQHTINDTQVQHDCVLTTIDTTLRYSAYYTATTLANTLSRCANNTCYTAVLTQ